MTNNNDQPPTPLTDKERAAGYRWSRLGKGPWHKLPPGTPTAADFGKRHRARVDAVSDPNTIIGAVVDKLSK
jgi:hypothetical protein